MDDDNAAPSTADINTASDAALAEKDFARYAEIENSRDAGKPVIPPKTAAPAPAKEPPDQTAAPEAAATDKPIQEKKPKGGEERKAELGAEIQALLKQRAELRAELDGDGKAKPEAKPGDKKADPPPAPAASAKAEAPKEPALTDFKTYGEYDVAYKAYVRELVAFEAKELFAADRAEQAAAAENKAHQAKWDEGLAALKEEHADFAEVAFSKNTPITNVMDGFILKSGALGPRILYKLGENGSAEGIRIAALDPYEAVEALAEIKRALTTPPKKDPPVKKITAAPPPATDLGGNNADPSDEAEAALAAKDFTRYERVMNAREAKQGH